MQLAKPVIAAGVATFACCIIHFFSAVYVPLSAGERQLSFEPLVVPATVLPYQPATLTQAIAQWQLPETEQTENDAGSTPDLSAFDNTLLGDTRVSLLAVYQLTKPVAVLALQQTDKPLRYVRLMAGDSDAEITVKTIAQRSITLSHKDTQASLRLFTPPSAATE